MVSGDRHFPDYTAIANLNSTSPVDFTASLNDEDIERDLALFANTEFLDFDFGYSLDHSSLDQGENKTHSGSRDEVLKTEQSGGTIFGSSNDTDGRIFNDSFSFDLDSLSSPTAIISSADESPSSKRQRIEGYPPTAFSTPNTAAFPLDEAARAAAEEDKRRRNTQASARFRAKKKLREQALEKTAKEQNDRIDGLEGRIKELEMENKWLRGLVTRRNP